MLRDVLLPELNKVCMSLLVCTYQSVCKGVYTLRDSDKQLLPKANEMLHKAKQFIACAQSAFHGIIEHFRFLEHVIAVCNQLPHLKDLQKPKVAKVEVYQVWRALLTDDIPGCLAQVGSTPETIEPIQEWLQKMGNEALSCSDAHMADIEKNVGEQQEALQNMLNEFDLEKASGVACEKLKECRLELKARTYSMRMFWPAMGACDASPKLVEVDELVSVCLVKICLWGMHQIMARSSIMHPTDGKKSRQQLREIWINQVQGKFATDVVSDTFIAEVRRILDVDKENAGKHGTSHGSEGVAMKPDASQSHKIEKNLEKKDKRKKEKKGKEDKPKKDKKDKNADKEKKRSKKAN